MNMALSQVVRTVPELMLRLVSGRESAGDRLCYYCGACCGEDHTVKEWVKPTFTARATVARPGSGHVCAGCVLCLRQDAELTLIDGEVRAGQKSQGYSYVLGGGRVVAATKAHIDQLRAVCLDPPEPPFAVVLSDSGQRHWLYCGVVNHARESVVVTLEGERVRYSPDELRGRLDLCGRLVAATGKPALAEPVDVRFAAAVMGRYRDGETLVERWEQVRTEPLSRLAGWLTSKKEDCQHVYPGDIAEAVAEAGRGGTPPAAGGTGGPEPKPRRNSGRRRRDEGDGGPSLFDLG